MIKQLILVFMYFILFPINLRLKKYVAELFQASKDCFKLVYYPDRYKTEKKCDEAFDDCLATDEQYINWILSFRKCSAVQ